MSKKILIPLPSHDFDPTETAVPWKILSSAGVEVIFATPDGQPGHCDDRMLNGTGLGPLTPVLAADKNGRTAYLEMAQSPEFNQPLHWNQIEVEKFDGIILPGGHAQGMREYLESKILQDAVVKFFESKKPVGAICHGVVLAARSKTAEGKSVLHGRKTTALLATQEYLAWSLTFAWLGRYYRTYQQTVESEVTAALASPRDFLKGPPPLFRDNIENLNRGFVVKDRTYVSARWPGDTHLFATAFLKALS